MNIQATQLIEGMPRVYDTVRFSIEAVENGFIIHINGSAHSDQGAHRVIAESPAEIALIVQAATEKLTYVAPRK